MERSLFDTVLEDYDINFKEYWRKAFREYKAPCYDSSMWLIGPSSYLFSFDGVRFAVDLQIRREKDLLLVSEGLVDELSDLSFVLITHQHDDHMCIPLMRLLKDTPIKWYLPYGTSAELVARSCLKEENITYVRQGDVIREGSIEIRVFDSPHLTRAEAESGEVFAEVGYEIVTKHGRVILPADVRDYDYQGYPKFEKPDVCISHLWAGGNAIDAKAYMPLLMKFSEFSARLEAKRYFFCHLYEIGREAKYMWHDEHAELAAERLLKLLPTSRVDIPRLGERYPLFEVK